MPGPRGTWMATGLAAANFAALNAWHLLHLEPISAGLKSPDGRLSGYSGEEIRAWLGALGETGRSDFLFWHTALLDRIFPALLSLALAMLFIKAGRQFPRFASVSAAWQWAIAAFLVLPYMLADYAENSAVAAMVRDPALAIDASVANVSALTALKWGFVATALIVPTALGLMGSLKNRSPRP